MALGDWFLTAAERRNPYARIDDVRPDGSGWTTGNEVTPLVHGATYFADLAERISAMGDGDRIYFVDWRGDPDEQLNDHGDTLVDVLVAALDRGVDVRGLLWRSHWRKFGFHSERAFELGKTLEAHGGECLRDMRVRTGGAHHQKFVVLRHRDDPSRDVAYVGGIDLCHSRRDDHGHGGDPQPLAIAPEYGPNPAWHDVQVAVRGPAVHDVETTFRERWEDGAPLTSNPGRRFTSWLQAEDQDPDPLGAQWPPPPPVEGGQEAVQIARTYPKILPTAHDFAPDGERSIALGNGKAMSRAKRLVYVEDQYLWNREVGEHFAEALRREPGLHLLIVLPVLPDLDGTVSRMTQWHARREALEVIRAAGGDRVGVFGLTNDDGLPIYVHSKVCIIDDRWASVGSDNFNRRSWSSDSEISCFVMDQGIDGLEPGQAAPSDGFPLRLRRMLCAEHLGVEEEKVPDDPEELFEAFIACATGLDAWYEAGAGEQPHGVRRAVAGLHSRHRRLPRSRQRGRARVARAAAAVLERSSASGARPAGRLRMLTEPHLTAPQRVAAGALTHVFDPDGTLGRRENLRRLVTRSPAPD